MKFYIFLSALLLVSSCSEERNSDLPSSEGLPDQESWGVTIIMTHEGFTKAKVKSGHLKKYNEKEHIILDQNVVVDFFDLQENHTSTLFSDKSEVNEKSNDMLAIGNVVAKSDSGITLFTERLQWIAEDEKLFTKDSIMITTHEKDTLFGKGFESNADLENWRILNPSGVTGSEVH
tara:strand:- start:1048 stop:1575 length:528 start_codon:yes stop_codon:yes gene_type:complete